LDPEHAELVQRRQLFGAGGDDRLALQGGHGLDGAEAEADQVAGRPEIDLTIIAKADLGDLKAS
jgi:hypothetical protein